jgi:hypothetical protein
MQYNTLMNKRNFLVSARFLFAGLNILAIGWQLLYGVLYQPTFNYVNFFSFFTILSNLFVTIVFIISAFRLARGHKPTPSDDAVRGASVLYMIVTGVIYTVLLADKDVGLTLLFVNLQLHFIMPVVAVLDWLYQPFLNKLKTRQVLSWLIFPFAYLVYSLIRGASIEWYPYPFLDPSKVGGYGGVMLYSAGVLVVFFVASFLLMKLANFLKLKRNVL